MRASDRTIPHSFHRKYLIQLAIPQPVNLLHFDLHRNTLFHRLYVADHADGFPGGVQRVERIQRRIQRLTVERAEPFIQEQRIDPRFMTHQIGKRQRQRRDPGR